MFVEVVDADGHRRWPEFFGTLQPDSLMTKCPTKPLPETYRIKGKHLDLGIPGQRINSFHFCFLVQHFMAKINIKSSFAVRHRKRDGVISPFEHSATKSHVFWPSLESLDLDFRYSCG